MAKKLIKKQDGGSAGDPTTKSSVTDKIKTKVKDVVTNIKQKIKDRNTPPKPYHIPAVPYSPPRMKKGGSVKKKK